MLSVCRRLFLRMFFLGDCSRFDDVASLGAAVLQQSAKDFDVRVCVCALAGKRCILSTVRPHADVNDIRQ